jgi:predicted nucleic acid-binding protein
VSDAVFLDTGPLGTLAKNPKKPEVAACYQWLASGRIAGRMVYLPEIADYELRRELLQRGFADGIARLDILKAKLIYLPITTDAMLLAADLWAQSRRGGQPTSDPHALDGDVILAAQMLCLPGVGYPPGVAMPSVAATGNAKHLSRFVRCAEWKDIVP